MTLDKITLLLIMFSLPTFVLADSATIENNVSSSASTGGGVKATASVKIYTEVNGEVVEDFEETRVSETGDVEIKVEAETKVSTGGEVKTESKVEVNGEVLSEVNENNETESAKEPEPEVSFVRKILNYVFSLFKF